MSCDREECVCLFNAGECPCPCNACEAENVAQPQPALLPKPAASIRPNFCGGHWWNGQRTQTCNAIAPPGEARCTGCKAREAQERATRARRLAEEPQKGRRRA